ncbi:ABC transporter permease [uncultured Sphaerochaeta sp.]|uniref:ABC transporter permease n=1 Tax=uncultured Sphaerochaeta sp. TaxID=886478 RepID=UPI002A0A5316|nr:ABC transporter permease [uncultured Sphaerochaeta sp.]
MIRKINTQRKTRIPHSAVIPALVLGMVIVFIAILIAFFPQLFTHHDPLEVNTSARMEAPSSLHFFGTDNYGRDIFSRVIYGTAIDLKIGIFGMLIPLVFGSILGLFSAFYGGFLDNLLMRIIDIFMAFPFTVLVIAIMTIMGPGIQNVYYSLWLVGWVSYAKLVRGDALSVKNSEYIQAARVSGFSDKRILFRHILPNVISSSIVFATSDVVLCMLTGASMSFLGLGVQVPTPEWGAIMNEGRLYISYAWWITFFPGLFMAITGIGFSLIGDSLTDIIRTKGH